MGWVINATPQPLYARQIPGTHYIGDWVGPRASPDGCGKSLHHRESIPELCRQQGVAHYTYYAISALPEAEYLEKPNTVRFFCRCPACY